MLDHNIATPTIEDMEAFRSLLARYVHGVDRGDSDLIKTCFHPESLDEHGPFRGTGYAFADNIRSSSLKSVQHLIASPYVLAMQADIAWIETTFICTLIRSDTETGADIFVEANGRYLDRLERHGGPWLIAHRKVVIDHSRETPLSPPWCNEHHFTRGKRNSSDPANGWRPERC